MARHGSVFSIAPHAPFLKTLADAVIGGAIAPDWPRAGAFWLSDMTLYLPTRRAANALSRLLADRLDTPMLLPDIRPLGGEDLGQEPFLPPYEPLDLKTPVGRLKRRLMLAELVERWLSTPAGATAFSSPGPGGFSGRPNSAEILALADSLATLIDDFAIARIDPSTLGAVPDAQLAAQFQVNLDFVAFVLAHWPAILDAEGEMEAAERTNILLERKARSLNAVHGEKPVIVAGSTGSIPATADLIAAIADLPNGAVVLAGVDTGLDPDTIDHLGDGGRNPHGHPHYGLVRLLRRLGTPPAAVTELAPELDHAPRTHILNAALALPQTTADWDAIAARIGPQMADGTAGVSLVAARTQEEEARAIAVCVHDALETGRTVAIIAPDQTLARRICAELRRFDIALDDPAGTPLARSRAGRLVRQAVSAVAGGLGAVDVMALFANRHVTLGFSRAEMTQAAHWLDLGVFRGHRPRPGFAGLRQAVAETLSGATLHRALKLEGAQAEAVLGLLDALEAALAPLTALLEGPGAHASTIALGLRETVSRLRAVPAGETPPALEGLAEMEHWLGLMSQQGRSGPVMAKGAIALALDGLLAGASVRPRRTEAEDVAIFGRLEARLMSADRVILSGLIESVWPEIADPGPWMSRGMRMAVGLEPPERLHGLAAHDFLMAAGAQEAVLTFSQRAGTGPATPSRLVQRLQAFVGPEISDAMAARGAVWLEKARRLDATGQPPRPAARPAPRPPAALRPRALAITEAETLLRSPYDLYARHVLGLRRIDPLGADPDHAERGTLIHGVIGDFLEEGNDPEAPDAQAELMALARARYGALDALPARRDLWLKRFEAIASAYLAFERGRFHIAARRAEISGAMEISLSGQSFTLRGRADRIDRDRSGAIEIIDFKTGQPPSPREMKGFLAPQLPLEAVMAREGAFGPGLAHAASELLFVKLSHGPNALETHPFSPADGMTLDQTVIEIWARFVSHVEAILLRDTHPMAARILPRPGQRFSGDYDHLARIDEWTLAEIGEDGEP